MKLTVIATPSGYRDVLTRLAEAWTNRRGHSSPVFIAYGALERMRVGPGTRYILQGRADRSPGFDPRD